MTTKTFLNQMRVLPSFTLACMALLIAGVLPANAAVERSSAPVEILRVAPAELRAGAAAEIVIGIYRSDIDPNKQSVTVSFGGTRVKAAAVEQTRAGFIVTARVPGNLGSTGVNAIVVSIGKFSSDPFRDFRFAIDELEILRVGPKTAEIGEPVVLTLSRPLTDAETKSLTINFQKQEILPSGISGNEIKLVIPETDSPTPAITITANNVTSKPYFDFIVKGLEIPATVGTYADNSSAIKGIVAVVIAIAILIIAISSVVRTHRRRVEQREMAQFRYKMETGQSGELVLDKEPAERTPDPPPELVSACAAGACVLFAASGLGAQAGFPTWREILHTIVYSANAEAKFPQDDTDWETVAQLLRGNDINTAARLIRSNLDNDFIFKELREAYDDANKDNTPIHKTLGRIPFQAGIRLGFDSVVEKAFLSEQPILCAPQTPTSISMLDANDRSSLVIYKLSGTIREPDSPILTIGEFRETIRENQPLARFMQGKFLSQPFLFAGVSPESIEQFLSVFGITSGGNVTHYALMHREEGTDAVTAVLREYGIKVLIYDATPAFPEFGDFMGRLADAVESSDITPQPRRKPSLSLNKITLDNVGPFDHLELELTDGWNVLLGNNGCGKTTILKAVSAALCGDKTPAKAAIGRLLQNGKDAGKIVLQVGDREYTTNIRREGRRVSVRSRQVTPLEAGSMLVLGFPALRGVSIESAKAPGAEDSAMADVDISDVLPLVSGGIDARMDSLTQWIINTESRGRDDPQHKRLLKQFFELMDKLTPGVKLKFGTIDKDDWRVLVDTDDGQIPIDLVSQGMSSIYSWAGCLLQRLQEVYPDSESFANEKALVLVDEIDAHMHPKWQQLIVTKLKESFPNIQFIATTHSPLITYGLETDEIIVARRAAEGEDAEGKVIVERSTMDPSAFYADQILTSPLFDLETSGDPAHYKATIRYTELSAKDSRTEQEESELEELSEKLDVRLPTPFEREEARIAWEAIQGAFEEQIKQMSEADRDLVRQEAKVQMQESVTGSRRQ